MPDVGEEQQLPFIFSTSREPEGLLPALRKGFSIHPFLQEFSRNPILSLGAEPESGLGLHRHPVNWLAQVRGRKLWLLLEPSRNPRAQGGAAGGALEAADEEGATPLLLASVRGRLETAERREEKGVLRCLREPGEVLLNPSDW